MAELVKRYTGNDELVPPGLQLESDPPEIAYLQRKFPWSSFATVAASPANNGRMQLSLPANSGLVAVIQGGGLVNKLTAGFLAVRGDAAAAGGGVSPVNGLDTRIPLDATGVPAVAVQNTISNANAVISGYIIDRAAAGAALQPIYSVVLPARPFILTPGHNITFFNETVNEQTQFGAWGYVRPVRPEELAL